MKEKLETILALDELISIALDNKRRSNIGSEEYEKWNARHALLEAKLEATWKTLK